MDEVDYWLDKALHRPYLSFLIIFLVSGLICVAALRHNNDTMIALRQNVYTVDKNNGDVDGALDKLRDYVFGHMNTNLSTNNNIKPPIQLKYTYARLLNSAQAAGSNAGLYTEAENYCQAQIPASQSFYGSGRIPCVTDYIVNHGGKAPAPIPAGLYEFDFSSPAWSPDLAGWSLVIVFASAVAAITSFILRRLK